MEHHVFFGFTTQKVENTIQQATAAAPREEENLTESSVGKDELEGLIFINLNWNEKSEPQYIRKNHLLYIIMTHDDMIKSGPSLLWNDDQFKVGEGTGRFLTFLVQTKRLGSWDGGLSTRRYSSAPFRRMIQIQVDWPVPSDPSLVASLRRMTMCRTLPSCSAEGPFCAEERFIIEGDDVERELSDHY